MRHMKKKEKSHCDRQELVLPESVDQKYNLSTVKSRAV